MSIAVSPRLSPAPAPLGLPHLLAVSDGGPSVQCREIGADEHRGCDVQDALESSGGAADLDGGKSGDARAGSDGRREVAGEESDGTDPMVAEATDGVDFDGDG
jgi:hypothetical protein